MVNVLLMCILDIIMLYHLRDFQPKHQNYFEIINILTIYKIL